MFVKDTALTGLGEKGSRTRAEAVRKSTIGWKQCRVSFETAAFAASSG